jgi:hypothetical protein
VLRIRRSGGLGGHCLILVLRLVVHRLLEMLRWRLPIDASMLVMLGRRCDRSWRVGLRRMVGHRRIGRSRHLCCGHHVGGIGGCVSACGTWCAVRTRVVVVVEVILVVGCLGTCLVSLRQRMR